MADNKEHAVPPTKIEDSEHEEPMPPEAQRAVVVFMNAVLYRTVYYRDMLMAALERILKEPSIPRGMAMRLEIQVKTLDHVIVNCLQAPVEAIRQARHIREGEENEKKAFQAEVDEIIGSLAPKLIVPGDPRWQN